MNTGTNLQEIVDAVKIKIPNENLSGKESQIVQMLKMAVSRCKKKTYDNLEFYYDEEILDGYFYNIISDATIELLSMYIVKNFLTWQFSIFNNRKQYLGTNAFNKIPSYKEKFDSITEQLSYWDNEIEKFEMDFPDYSEDR